MRKISCLLVLCAGIFSFSSGQAKMCKQVHTVRSIPHHILSGPEIVQAYEIKPSQVAEFLFRFSRDVENDYTWAQAGNPRISGSGDSLIVDMYRYQNHNLSQTQKRQLIDGRRSVPGQILFRHVLFQSVL